MIVMPQLAAARVAAFGASVGWNFLLPAADGGPPTSQHLRVDLPDPNQSAAGLATLVQIGRMLGNGAAARTAFAKFVFSVEVTSQFQGPLGLTPFVTLANPPLNGNPVTVTSEQAVLQYDHSHASQPLAARYPWSRTPGLGSPELDYPYLVTASQSGPAHRGPRIRAPAQPGLRRRGACASTASGPANGVADVMPRQFGLAYAAAAASRADFRQPGADHAAGLAAGRGQRPGPGPGRRLGADGHGGRARRPDPRAGSSPRRPGWACRCSPTARTWGCGSSRTSSPGRGPTSSSSRSAR